MPNSVPAHVHVYHFTAQGETQYSSPFISFISHSLTPSIFSSSSPCPPNSVPSSAITRLPWLTNAAEHLSWPTEMDKPVYGQSEGKTGQREGEEERQWKNGLFGLSGCWTLLIVELIKNQVGGKCYRLDAQGLSCRTHNPTNTHTYTHLHTQTLTSNSERARAE